VAPDSHIHVVLLGADGQLNMIRVVIVNGRATVRDTLLEQLARSGRFGVIGCTETVREAEVLLGACPADVIVAVPSPEAHNAVDLLRALKRHGRGAPVLIMAGLGEDFSAAEALRAGAAGCIFTHQPTGEILRAIEEVVAGSRRRGGRRRPPPPGRPRAAVNPPRSRPA
jgi:DNA-binding NarL/FixJ family response regulator